MQTSDLEFAINTAVCILFGILSFFRLDRERVQGKLLVPQMKRRDLFFGIAFACNAVFTGLLWYHSGQPQITKWIMRPDQEKVIYGQHFENVQVEIDGKRFDHCSFKNVTLMYHGLAPVDFQNSTLEGGSTIFLVTDNDAARGFAALGTHFYPASLVSEGTIDEHGNRTPQIIQGGSR